MGSMVMGKCEDGQREFFYNEAKCEHFQEWMISLGEKPHFSTCFHSTTFQLSFVFENIIFNYKMFFATQKWCCQLISKIVDNVESTLQHSWKRHTCVNLWLMLRWQHFS
jgi:hypothetical protein